MNKLQENTLFLDVSVVDYLYGTIQLMKHENDGVMISEVENDSRPYFNKIVMPVIYTK